MKTKFKAFQKPSTEEIKRLLESGTVIFDTNALLNLYRYKEHTRNKFFDLLDKIKERVWIPYHVGIEYQNNKKKVLNYRDDELNEIKSRFDSAKNQLKQSKIKKGHREVDLEEFISEVEHKFSEKLNEIEGTFEARDLSKESLEVDTKIHDIFDGKVGNPFKENELELIYEEGKKRYEHSVPPGYMDLKEKENEVKLYGNLPVKQAFGDLIIWKEILNYTSASQLDSTLFITDDLKQDWYLETKQSELMARPELGQEFHETTGKQSFAIINSELLIQIAQQVFNLGIDQSDVENIQEAQKDFQETTRRLRKSDAEEAIFEHLEEMDLVTFKRRDDNFDAILKDSIFSAECTFDLKFIRKTYNTEQFKDMISNNLEKTGSEAMMENYLCFATSQRYRYEEVLDKLNSALQSFEQSDLTSTSIRLFYIVRNGDHYKVKSVKKILN